MSMKVAIRKVLGNFNLDVSFEAENGTIALLGASGCGKSLTLRCICGIDTPDEGYIEMDGKVLFDSKNRVNLPPQQRQIGYMFQHYALFPNMSVKKNIYISATDGKKAHTDEIIDRFKLRGLENKYPFQLSGGEKQRVALARIIASRPKAILLDEPFSAMDSFLKYQLESEISDILSEFSGTCIWVSHNRDEIYRNCGKICVLEDGKSSPTVTSDDLFRDPVTVGAARLSGCKNFADILPNSENSVYVPKWDVYLSVSECADGRKSIGIRSHHVHPIEENDTNIIKCTVVRIIRDIFSTSVILSPTCSSIDAPLLRMDMDRSDSQKFDIGDQISVGISPENIMLLK